MATLYQRLRHSIGDSFGAQVVEANLEKAIQTARDRAVEPKSSFYDPTSLFMGREWFEKGNRSLRPSDLRAMAKNPIIGSIIQTRLSQIAAFCTPQISAYDYGYVIRSDHQDAQESVDFIALLRDWIYCLGERELGEPNLEVFARKFMRDSLILDQATAEIIPKRNKQPSYLVAVDAATIQKLPASLLQADTDLSEPYYVQVIDDKITTYYTRQEMIFGVRNPQTEINTFGYGISELETLVRTVSTILNTERYNTAQLAQGGTQKGVFVIKGTVSEPEMQAFRRDFREAIRNAASYWRPPVLQVKEGADIDWVTLDRSNRDMEYAALFEFLVKQATSIYQMDPSEINWSINAHGTSTNFEGRNDLKISASQQRGLRPLLNFLSTLITQDVISLIDPRYRLEFVGMDRDRAQDAEIREREVKSYKTVNEQRQEMGLNPIKGGDIILSEYFMGKSLDVEDGDEEVDVDVDEELSNQIRVG